MQNCNLKFKNNLADRCYRFSLNIVSMTNEMPSKKSALIIADQLIRSATSIGANLVEAGAASSRLEFKKYNEISLKSANETKYWLNLIKDCQLVNQELINLLLKEATELSNMLASGILKLKKLKI